ncbi:hypothetical protein T4E_11799 [Trichinella pseudospiralis]|uniref:Uncharacterized protein n=1 Tax=Trichinella pseudospiralis TaxID=6337 RepID=A0A0V0XPN0_TRIPS|nr:hypothetical protein T4E_11799 [Trichinella pseudospiralis]
MHTNLDVDTVLRCAPYVDDCYPDNFFLYKMGKTSFTEQLKGFAKGDRCLNTDQYSEAQLSDGHWGQRFRSLLLSYERSYGSKLLLIPLLDLSFHIAIENVFHMYDIAEPTKDKPVMLTSMEFLTPSTEQSLFKMRINNGTGFT